MGVLPPFGLPAGWLLALGAGLAALALAIAASALLGLMAEERDLATRLRGVLRPAEGSALPRPRRRGSALRPLLRLGEMVRDSALVSEQELSQFQRAVAAAGMDGRQAVPLLLGAKALLFVVGPLAGLLGGLAAGLKPMGVALAAFAGIAAAIYLPNMVVRWLKGPFQEKLRRGLPDALDLMVVAAEAGLGLETAVERVAREMDGSNRAISIELTLFVQEMRMLPDRRMALERLAERTGLEGFRRLGATLAQTMRYGTPLAQALRVLAAEMRQERMLRLEEKAVRLPAMLIGPLILFILPALFIALIGPSVLEMGKSFGGR
jgi:tight adherence protein C